MTKQFTRQMAPLGLLHRLKLQGLRLLAQLRLRKAHTVEGQAVRAMGLTFPNRCGVAGGIDNHGDYIDALAVTGAAYLTIGPITPRATALRIHNQMRRGKNKQLILERHRLVSKGMMYLRKQLAKCHFRGILALTLSKQPETSAVDVIHDFRASMQEVYPYANFLVFDFTWFDWEAPSSQPLRPWLADLLLQLKIEQGVQITTYHRYVPLMVKIRPDLPESLLSLIAALITEIQFEGVVLADQVVVDELGLQTYAAGLPAVESTQRAIMSLRKQLPSTAAIIAEGGNIDIQHASLNLAAGADLLGIYSGWFLGGETLCRQLAKL